MLTFLYNIETGEYQGNTLEPNNYTCGKTTIEPPIIDDFEYELFFIDGAWETRQR
jgi:hypothetical protein